MLVGNEVGNAFYRDHFEHVGRRADFGGETRAVNVLRALDSLDAFRRRPPRPGVSWRDLFERAAAVDADAAAVRAAVDDRRAEPPGEPAADAADPVTEPRDPSPARVVADADVLAADLLVGGDARDALDGVRAHSWVTLVASDPLLDDAEVVVAAFADDGLAANWRARVEQLREPVSHPAGDHPALASTYRGGAMHLLTYAEDLRSAGAGATLRGRVETSVRSPRAFATVFDPGSLYAAVEGGEYPGPDRDPRA